MTIDSKEPLTTRASGTANNTKLPSTNMKQHNISYFIVLSTLSSEVTEYTEISYPLISTEEVMIGREETCQIVLNSEQYPTVSRYHTKIQSIVDGSGISWQVCDLNAANGTYVNAQRLQRCQILQSGDRIMLGKDGPEFLFRCEVVSSSRSPEPTQETTPLLAVGMITPPDPDPSPLSQSTTVPVILPTQPVIASSKNVEQNSSRSLWDLSSESNIIVLSGHGDLVRSVAFSPDGKHLATGSADKSIKIWDLTLEKESQTLVGHKLAISAVAFSPDGKCLASGSADKTIKIWNLALAEEIQQLAGHGMGVNTVAFSPDSKCLASGSADKTIKIWDLASGEIVQTLVGHKMGINAVVFSPDNEQLASGSADRTVKFWKILSGDECLALPAFRSSINALFFSPDQKNLAIFTDDKMIRLWDLEAEQEIRVLSGYSWQTGSLAISIDGQKFASGSEDKAVRVWKL
jgi:pSer/pThr/pTyr-binding forkhead associated (FHA) protein